MVIRVVNKSQRILGYMVDGYFYPASVINSLVDDIEFSRTIFGYEKRNGVLVGDNLYRGTDYLMRLRNKNVVLDYNDLSFIERKPTEDELVGLSSFWQIIHRKNRYFYTIVDKELNILGYFITTRSIYYSTSCYLAMIEIIDKNRGTGTKVVSKLKDMISITGISCVDAVDFWTRNGAVFHNNNRFDLIRNI